MLLQRLLLKSLDGAQNPEHQIQSIRMDNAAEFSSKAFNKYCMALEIQV